MTLWRRLLIALGWEFQKPQGYYYAMKTFSEQKKEQIPLPRRGTLEIRDLLQSSAKIVTGDK